MQSDNQVIKEIYYTAKKITKLQLPLLITAMGFRLINNDKYVSLQPSHSVQKDSQAVTKLQRKLFYRF